MNMANTPWLELALGLPLVGAVVLTRTRAPRQRWRIAVAISALTTVLLGCAWADLAWLDIDTALLTDQLVELTGSQHVFVVDELNAPLLPIAGLIVTLTLLTTLRTRQARFAFAEALVIETLVLGTLSCRDPDLLALLLGIGALAPLPGLRRRRVPTRLFGVHAVACVALLLAGWVALRTASPGSPAAPTLFAGALLIRCGVAPFHAWITHTFERAGFGDALLFTTPMVGLLGFMRLVLPEAPPWLLQAVSVLALCSALIAVALSLVQRDARRLIAYLFLSHSSIVLMGLDLDSPVCLTGALSLWLSVMLALTGLALVLRCLEERVGRLSLERHHGLYEHVPMLAVFFLLTGLASIGFPGTPGFAGAELLIEGAVDDAPLLGVGLVIVSALSGVAILRAYFHLFTGCVHPATLDLGIRRAERLAVLTLALLLIGGGLLPQPGIATRHHAARVLLAQRTDPATTTSKPDHP